MRYSLNKPIIMNSGKDKENVKQKVAQNSYNTLINESKETNQSVQPNSMSKNCTKLNEICTQNNKNSKGFRSYENDRFSFAKR